MRIKRVAIDCISVEMNLNELHIAEGKAVMFLEMPEAFSIGVGLFDAYLPKEVSESADHIAGVSKKVYQEVTEAEALDMLPEVPEDD